MTTSTSNTPPSTGPWWKLFEFVKSAKELLIAFSVIAAALVFVRDYFATRIEVEVLRCQMDAGRSLILARLDIEELSKEVIDLTEKLRIDSYVTQRSAIEVAKQGKEDELKKLRASVSEFASKLDQRVCLKEVKP